MICTGEVQRTVAIRETIVSVQPEDNSQGTTNRPASSTIENECTTGMLFERQEYQPPPSFEATLEAWISEDEGEQGETEGVPILSREAN